MLFGFDVGSIEKNPNFWFQYDMERFLAER
jgi:hypothetical protein